MMASRGPCMTMTSGRLLTSASVSVVCSPYPELGTQVMFSFTPVFS